MKITKGDKFRLVKGVSSGWPAGKHVCTGTAVEPVSKNGHNGITVVKFTALDYFGKPCKYAVPLDWCAYEPPNTAARKKRA